MRSLDQILALLIHIADTECLIQIAMVAVLVHDDVDVHDVTVLQRPGVGNAVTLNEREERKRREE